MAISFAGGTDFASWGVPPSVPVNGCIAFLMKTSQATANAALPSLWDGASRNGWGFILNNVANKLTAVGYATTSTPSIGLVSTSNLNNGAWRHVAFNYRRNSGSNALFIDGASEASGNTGASWNPSGSPTMAISRLNGFWAAYVGQVAEMAHWSANLDADEIAALAKGFSPKIIRPTSLLFHAPLIRAMRDIRGLAVSLTGTSVSDHPRVIGEGG